MKFRQSLFWDTDPRTIDVKKNALYIIERIVDFGNDQEVRWLWKTYTKPLLKKIVTQSKSLRPRSKALWTLLLEKK